MTSSRHLQCVLVCAFPLGEGSDPEFRERIIIMCANPALVALSRVAVVVAEV